MPDTVSSQGQRQALATPRWLTWPCVSPSCSNIAAHRLSTRVEKNFTVAKKYSILKSHADGSFSSAREVLNKSFKKRVPFYLFIEKKHKTLTSIKERWEVRWREGEETTVAVAGGRLSACRLCARSICGLYPHPGARLSRGINHWWVRLAQPFRWRFPEPAAAHTRRSAWGARDPCTAVFPYYWCQRFPPWHPSISEG